MIASDVACLHCGIMRSSSGDRKLAVGRCLDGPHAKLQPSGNGKSYGKLIFHHPGREDHLMKRFLSITSNKADESWQAPVRLSTGWRNIQTGRFLQVWTLLDHYSVCNEYNVYRVHSQMAFQCLYPPTSTEIWVSLGHAQGRARIKHLFSL